jgi:tagatose 6-phosphate kinase
VIVTVTLNPVLRVEYAADHIAKGRMNQVRRVRYLAGGRGLAVARVLHTFGHDVVAGGLAGGSAGELIRNELARAGVATQFTRIAAESRRVVAVADESDGQVTAFTEPAPYITTEELGRLASDYRDLLNGATAVVLCGSLPDGLPTEIYGSFTAYAAEAGVPVILDAGGSALAHGAARRPALVVPEVVEGPDVTGLPALADSVALLTGESVLVLTGGGKWRAGLRGHSGGRPRQAGEHAGEALRDALVAGLVPGIALAWSWPDILRHAVALGAAWSPDGGLDAEAYEDSLTAVDVQRLPAEQ